MTRRAALRAAKDAREEEREPRPTARDGGSRSFSRASFTGRPEAGRGGGARRQGAVFESAAAGLRPAHEAIREPEIRAGSRIVRLAFPASRIAPPREARRSGRPTARFPFVLRSPVSPL